jgi:opacity protein-like surface antigen
VERLTLAAAVLALAVTFPRDAFAQERARVAEDTLIKDPEVAALGKWKVGGALEYWYVRETTYPPQGSGTSNFAFNESGGNAFVGYDNFTFQYTHRSGEGHLDTGASVAGSAFTTDQELKVVNNEVTLRWLARDFSTRFVTPYLLAGYAWVDTRADINITTGQRNACTGTSNYSREFKFTAPLLGIGGIFPVTETMGARLDGRYKRYHVATHTLGACPEVTADGTGGDLTATGYYLITPSWNFQLGAKYQTIPGPAIQNAPGAIVIGNTAKRMGMFGMLGYSHEF